VCSRRLASGERVKPPALPCHLVAILALDVLGDLGADMGRSQCQHARGTITAMNAQPGTDGKAAHTVADQCHSLVLALGKQGLDRGLHHRGIGVNGAEQRLQIDREDSMTLCAQLGCHIVPNAVVAEVPVDQNHGNALLVAGCLQQLRLLVGPGLMEKKDDDTRPAFTKQ